MNIATYLSLTVKQALVAGKMAFVGWSSIP